jgi:glycerol-3-phosphate dehydrogenase
LSFGAARLGAWQRSEHLQRMGCESFDTIVVGGGVTGLGAALDAVTRGLSVAVLEAGDLAQGTSSRSGKTLHGGLRYLEQGNFRLVREAARERNLSVSLLCPHLTRPTPFLFPLHSATWQRAYLGAGVLIYDVLGGARTARMPWHRHLGRTHALALCPGLDPARLRGALQYYDVIFDDARHAMLVGRTAVHYGAALATGAAVTGIHADPTGRVTGVRATDIASGESFEVRGRSVINAAGAWADRVQALAGEPSVRVQPSKGVHLVVARDRIAADTGIVTRTADSVLFIRPWNERFWILGTTDTPYRQAREDPVPATADIDYLLAQANAWLARPLVRQDVTAAYAGIRPLVSGRDARATAALSRDHAVVPGPPRGMFTIVGGKYTTYRRMAQDVVDAAAGWLGGGIPGSVTDRTPLPGGDGWDALRQRRQRLAAGSGLSAEWIDHLLGRYGSLTTELLALVGDRPELASPVAGAPGYLRAEIVYAATHEGARTLQDVLFRRTHIAIETRDRGLAAAEQAAELVAPELGWSAADRDRDLRRYREWVEVEVRAEQAGEPPSATEH